jgi:hypothetical protein
MPGVGKIPRGEVREMTAMTRRERILATTQKKRADRLPFFHWWRHLQIGWAERECRNRGMGLAWDRPCYVTRIHNVVITEEKNPSRPGVIRITYSTPQGRVYMDEKRDPGTGQWHEQRSWKDVSPWAIKRLIREPEDYEIVKYIVENTEYLPDYFPIEQAKEWVGEEGVVLASLHKTPMARLMIEWIGSEEGRFYIHHKKYKDQLEDLYRAMCKSMEPLYEIAAKSPADLVWMGENTEGLLVSPPLFEKYFMPEYEKCARVFHGHGKMMAVHMDGRLNVLKNLIARTPIDIIEAFHPPPMGDLALSEALAVWKEKVLWMGFPAAIYSLGSVSVKDYTLELLRSIVPGDRLAIAMSTENLVTDEHLRLLTSILENAELPLTEEKVERIKRSLF